MDAHICRVYLYVLSLLNPGYFSVVDAPKLVWNKANAERRGAGWDMTTQSFHLYPGSSSPITFDQVWGAVIQSSGLVMRNMAPSAPVPPQIFASPPSNNLITKSRPSLSARYLVGVLITYFPS